MAKISVLMPAFNSSLYIEESIQSILNQTFSDFEFIIINDGSTDKTHDIIASFNDKRIRYFQNDGNKGLAYTRNKLVELSTSNYIAFLDSDDIAKKNRLEIQHQFLTQNKNIGLVAASVESLDDKGAIENKNWNFNLSENELPIHLLFYNPIVTSAILFKKEILPSEIFREDYPPCEDYDLWTRMLYKNKGIVLPEIVATYRLHNNSVSKRKAEEAILNRNKIILNQLDYYFSNDISETDKQLHLSLVDFNLHTTTKDIELVKTWIQKLLQFNQTHQYFDQQILKQVLYERILKKLLRLTDYNFSVYQNLMEFKKIAQPSLTFELRKKELAILAFSITRKKLM